MRLLDAEKLTLDNLLTLKEFGEHELPGYAILSHTWLDPNKDEVSFKDIQVGNRDEVIRKPGFKKIQYCCEEAIDRGIRWVWVDTCCTQNDPPRGSHRKLLFLAPYLEGPNRDLFQRFHFRLQRRLDQVAQPDVINPSER